MDPVNGVYKTNIPLQGIGYKFNLTNLSKERFFNPEDYNPFSDVWTQYSTIEWRGGLPFTEHINQGYHNNIQYSLIYYHYIRAITETGGGEGTSHIYLFVYDSETNEMTFKFLDSCTCERVKVWTSQKPEEIGYTNISQMLYLFDVRKTFNNKYVIFYSKSKFTRNHTGVQNYYNSDGIVYYLDGKAWMVDHGDLSRPPLVGELYNENPSSEAEYFEGGFHGYFIIESFDDISGRTPVPGYLPSPIYYLDTTNGLQDPSDTIFEEYNILGSRIRTWRDWITTHVRDVRSYTFANFYYIKNIKENIFANQDESRLALVERIYNGYFNEGRINSYENGYFHVYITYPYYTYLDIPYLYHYTNNVH